jgi:protein O-GlcNAc transferase
MTHTDPGGRNDVAPLFDQALALFQAGRLAEAKRIARRILADEPKHARALHLLGVALSQQGNHTEGLRFIDAAMQVEGQSASIHNSRGNVLVALQRFDEAVASYDT